MRMFFALTLLPAVVMAGQPIFTLISGYLDIWPEPRWFK